MIAEGIQAMHSAAALVWTQEGTEALIPIALFAMIALIVWFGTRVGRTAIQEQAELRRKLVEKFGSAQELAAFIESEAGRQFLAETRGRSQHGIAWPHRFLIPGVIMTGLGGAFFALGHDFFIPAVIVLTLGICFIVLAALFHKLGAKGCGGAGSRPDIAS